ncbi:ABC transporter substrate-binding protein [Methylobacterium sp. E-045]|uniref:ABC transporter substrate-binding protein n=1 Tax=Methylobacterium sp. E-045 TaxID=2836575 RepID=UPI00391D270F
MNRRSALLCLAGAAAGASSLHAEEAGKITLVDDRGVPVTVSRAPKRLAAVSYAPVDAALALGTMPVATTYMSWRREPDYLLGLTGKMKQLGQRARPNLERLAEMKPDVTVAVRRYTEGNAARYAAIAPYLAYDLEVFGDSDRIVEQMAMLLDQTERGQALNIRFKEDLSAFTAGAPKDRHLRFQIMWAGDTPYTFYSEHMAAALVVALGGTNVAGPNPTPHVPGRFGFEMSLEAMLAKDPEVIFVYDSGSYRPHENNPVWTMLSAVRNGRVTYVGDHWVEPHGPVARHMVLREAAHLLYPDLFPKPDIHAEAAKMIRVSL